MTWTRMSRWWRSEVDSDPAYEDVVTPLLLDVLQPEPGRTYLDVGCGEGRVMRSVSAAGAQTIGVDLSLELVDGLPHVVVADALSLPFRSAFFEGVYCVLTLEHIEDHRAFFSEVGEVTVRGGALALVVNHPVWTAPGSTPITDEDGEVLWRPGDYFSTGTSEIPASGGTILFYHRSMGELLSAAADAGWHLERMVEQPHHEFEDQSGIPRLLGCRWRLG